MYIKNVTIFSNKYIIKINVETFSHKENSKSQLGFGKWTFLKCPKLKIRKYF